MASTNNIKQLLKFHFLDINSYNKYTILLGSSNRVLVNLKLFRTLSKKDQSCKKCVQVTSNVRICPCFFFKFLPIPNDFSQLKSNFVPNVLHSQKIYVTHTFYLRVVLLSYVLKVH